ncbi:hypothetical protein EMGBS4_12990 [Acidimicrobiaceae bacterium]|nr:hypothetical protein EMGBS4_12990 [Acidimicrobiaceae bacterium]
MSVSISDVRADLVFAHEQAWSALSHPGTWWSGAQRRELAITAILAVNEVEPSPPWVAASTVADKKLQILFASSAAHDVVYRIARHAATLTKDWYQRTTQEIDPLAFIELCGIVCTVATVVAFRRALDLDPPELAPATPGEPSRIKPDNVVAATLNWVPVIAPADENAAVVQAFTAVPETNRVIWAMADAQYIPDKEMVDPHWTRGTLSRVQMELVATRVSQQRECFY